MSADNIFKIEEYRRKNLNFTPMSVNNSDKVSVKIPKIQRNSIKYSIRLHQALGILAQIPIEENHAKIFYVLEEEIRTNAQHALRLLSRFAYERSVYDIAASAKDKEDDCPATV